MLFLILSLCSGPVAEALTERGVAFSGLKFAVCAPEGDSTGELISRLTGQMQDIRSYAAFQSMEPSAALEALEQGQINAVLLLPEDFISGILEGSNPGLTLVVSGSSPLEGILAQWVGQSAVDLLHSAQTGIYGVLENHDGSTGLSYDQMVTGINMAYIRRVLDRQSFFRVETLRSGAGMTDAAHYALSILLFLAMSLPPLFQPLFSGDPLAFRRRLASLGQGAGFQYGCNLWVCCWVCFGLMLLPTALLSAGGLWGLAPAAVFAGCWCAFCACAAGSEAGCAALGFFGSGAMLFLSGGILPRALLPRGLQVLGDLLPVGMLRRILYLPPAGWKGADLAGVILWCSLLAAAGAGLWRRRMQKGGS